MNRILNEMKKLTLITWNRVMNIHHGIVGSTEVMCFLETKIEIKNVLTCVLVFLIASCTVMFWAGTAFSNPVFLNQLRRAWTPEPVPDLDPGFTGVTTFYETVNIHSQANKRRLSYKTFQMLGPSCVYDGCSYPSGRQPT